MEGLINKVNIFVNLVIPQYLILIIFTTISSLLILKPSLMPLIELLLIIISTSFAAFGLNAFNQIFDIEIDRITKPNRPLPSRKLNKRQVYLLSLLFFIISFVIALFVNPIFTYIILFFISLSILYSLPPIRLKRWRMSSIVIGGTLYGALPFLSISTISNSFSWVFFVLFYGLTLSIATTKDIGDVIGDIKFNIKTIPTKFGFKFTLLLNLMGIFTLLLFMLFLSIFQFISIIFLYPIIISLLVLSLMAKYYKKNFNHISDYMVTTESKLTILSMIFVIFIELIFGITAIFV